MLKKNYQRSRQGVEILPQEAVETPQESGKNNKQRTEC